MLKDKARNLRKNQTDAEKRIWNALRNRQIDGNRFHRQFVIGQYIVDFVCREKDLIVEIDGGQHSDNKKDIERTQYLEKEGYRVIRFWNNDVMNNLEGVLQDITKELEALTPTLSLKGEGVLPTPKMERWKYTNLPAKLKKFDLQEGEADIVLSGMTDYAYAFPKVMDSFPTWAKEIVNKPVPGEQRYKDMMLWQAANDVLKNGFILDVPANEKISKALEITYTGHDKKQTTARQVIRIAEGAEMTLIEYQLGAGQYWNNIVTQVEVAKGASFKHYRFQENSDEAVVTQNTHIVMAERADYEAFTFTGGGKASRNQVHVDMMGEHAVCRLNGVNMLDGSEHGDTTITVEHQAPNCNSFQNYRTVVTDTATSVFQGKIHVHKIAQKTDGYQMAKSLLLSGQATVNTKPELEIYADDVKCSHGATTGRLDEEALFYLQSRGIPEAQARNLLIEAFVNEVIEEISHDDVQEQTAHIVNQWLTREDEPANEEWLD